MKLSFVLATTGRSSVEVMLRSIYEQDQISHDDEIIIVGNPRKVEYSIKTCTGPVNFLFLERPLGNNWGHDERNFGMRCAIGDYIVFVDDDDALVPGAVGSIKESCAKANKKPVMFRMIDQNGLVLWTDKEIRKGNHGTPQFVVPNNPARLGTWGNRYEGDFDFVTSTLTHYEPGDLIWDESIIYGCREQGRRYWI